MTETAVSMIKSLQEKRLPLREKYFQFNNEKLPLIYLKKKFNKNLGLIIYWSVVKLEVKIGKWRKKKGEKKTRGVGGGGRGREGRR